MSDSNLTVKITGDVVDLQAKFAVAKAEQAAFASQLRSVAKEASAAGATIDDALKTRLLQASENALTAQHSVNEFGSELAKLSPDHVGVHGIREISALVRELAEGNLTRLPGTFALLSHEIGGMGLAGVAAAAGIVALGAGLAELAIHEAAVREASESMRAALAFRGLDESKEQVEALIDKIRNMPGATTEAAEKTVRSFGEIRDATPELKNALADVLPVIAKSMGTDIPKAAETMAAVFKDVDKNGEDFLRQMHASADTVNAFVEASSHGDRAAAFSIVLRQIYDGVAKANQELARSPLTEPNFFESMVRGFAMAAGGVEQVEQAVEKIDLGKLKAISDDFLKGMQSSSTTPKLPDTRAEYEAQLAQIRDDTRRSNTAILSDEIALVRQRLANDQIYGTEKVQLQRQLAELELQLGRETGNEAIAQTRNQVSAIAAAANTGSVQKLTQQRQAWAQLLASDKLTYQQRLDAQKSFNEASAALERARKSENDAIEKSDADTALQISRISLEAKRNALGEEFAAHRITAKQEYDLLRQYATEEEALNEQVLEHQLATLKDEPAKYEETYNQIRLLRAKLTADLAKFDLDEVRDAQKGDTEQVRAWKNAVNEMGNAESSLISNIFSGRQKLSISLLQISSQMLQRELANDAKWLTTKLLYNALNLKSDQSTAQGGLLAHLYAELTKTEATAAGTSARVSIQASGEAAGKAMTAAGARSTIMTDAAEAASGAYSSAAQIPYVGWILGPIAAAVAFAAVMAFGSGIPSAACGMVVPQDTLAMVHMNEMVLPAPIRAGLLGIIGGGGSGAASSGAATGGGAAPVQVTFQVQAMDASSVAAFFAKNGRALARTVSQFATNNPALRPSY